MQIKCKCGKLLKIPESFAGKNAKCPACGKVLRVPAAPSGASKIIVTCECGKRLSAPASAAGKRVRCPGCGAEIVVPPAESPAAAAQSSGLELDYGSKADADEPDIPQEDMFGVAGTTCPNCGAAMEPGSQFCVECGTSIATGAKTGGVDAEKVEKEKKTDRKTVFIIGGAVAAVVVVLGVTLFFVPFKRILGRDSTRDSAASGDTGGLPPPPAERQDNTTPRTGRVEREQSSSYLGTLVQAHRHADSKTKIIQVEHSIKAFQATEGRLPKDLKELEEAGLPLA